MCSELLLLLIVTIACAIIGHTHTCKRADIALKSVHQYYHDLMPESCTLNGRESLACGTMVYPLYVQ